MQAMDITTVAPGGIADASAQDRFCSGTTCSVEVIYDQSPQRNHITTAPGGGACHNADRSLNANNLKISIGGHPAYAAAFDKGGAGYRRENTTGVAVNHLDTPDVQESLTSTSHPSKPLPCHV